MSDYKAILKEQMIKYGFTAPDMTVTEFVEDIVPSAEPDFSCEGCTTPKHICGICMRNYPNITDHYCTGEASREAKNE